MKKNIGLQQYDSKLILEELEPRQLFSGGVEGLLVSQLEPQVVTYVNVDANLEQTAQSQSQAEHQDIGAKETKSNEIVFVDVGVTDYQAILHNITQNAGTAKNIEVVQLETSKNGFDQISEILAERADLDVVHIIAQGNDGAFKLGNNALDPASLAESNPSIARWSNAFRDTGDILIHGSDQALAEVGQDLINSISSLIKPGLNVMEDLTDNAINDTTGLLKEQSTAIVLNNAKSDLTQTALIGLIATETSPSEDSTGNSFALADPIGEVSKELVFVDTRVSNYQQLVDDITSNGDSNRQFEIVMLDANRDGITQITQALSTRNNLAAVHLITHGSDGSVDIGNNQLNFQTLVENQTVISAWGNAFSSNGDFLVYGCNVAATQFGQSFIDYLSNITNTDVAASIDVTGHESLGGDWDLEMVSGKVEMSLALSTEAQQEWFGLLGDVTLHLYETTIENMGDQAYELKSSQPQIMRYNYNSPDATYTVNKIGLVLYGASDTSAQTITVSLRSTYNGAVIASGTIASSSLGTSEAWVNVTLSSAATLNDSQDYFIRIESNTDAGKVYVGVHDSGTYSTGAKINPGDGTADGSKDMAFRLIQTTNAAPTVTTTGTALTYTENGAATAVDGALTVTDSDSTNLVSATVSITSGFVSGQDVLAFTNQNGITGSWNASTGVLTLTGSASVANYQTALRSITYVNTSDNPSTTARTVSFVVNDGSANSITATRNISITAVNDSPINTVPSSQTTNEDIPKVFSSANGNQISITDVDAGGNNEITLSVTNGTLSLSGTAGLTFIVGDGTADTTMTLRGTASAINTALNGLSYSPTTDYNGSATLNVATKDSVLLSLDITANLLGHYTFENTGALGADTSPAAGYPGTVSGATAVVDGTRGNVLNLDGNDYIQTTGHFGNPANVTLSAWVNLSAADTLGSHVITLDEPTGGHGVSGVYYNGTTWVKVTSGQYVAGTGWHHVAFSFDDAGNAATLYLDGVAVTTTSTADSISYAQGANSFIGKHGNGNTSFDFTGKIDDARIYNRVLTASEIATLATDLTMTDADTVAITVTAVNDAPSGGVSITGTAAQGQLLTTSHSLLDADGLGAITYTWKADGTAIGTGSSYTLGEAEVGKAITATASYSDGHGTA